MSDTAMYKCLVCGAEIEEGDVISVDVREDWGDVCCWKYPELMSLHPAMSDMRSFIRENGVTDMADFWDWCDENNDRWSRALDSGCARPIGAYIDQQRAGQASAT